MNDNAILSFLLVFCIHIQLVTSMPGRSTPARLSVFEQAVYWITEFATISYMLYSLYHASVDAWRKNKPIPLEEGWAVIGRPRDTGDFEWSFWSSFFWDIVPWICGHFVLSNCVNLCCRSVTVKHWLLTLYGFAVTSYLLGFYTVLFFCVLPVVLFVVSELGSALAVWLTTLIFLTVLNVYEDSMEAWLYSTHYRGQDFRGWFYTCVFVWANLCQRATAFALECVWVVQTQAAGNKMHSTKNSVRGKKAVLGWSTLTHRPSWLDLFFYTFYLPLFFTGPLLVYNQFYTQSRQPYSLSRQRLRDIVLKLARFLFWAVMNSLMLHFIYPHAINSNSHTLAKQSRWTLVAIGFVLGQFFMMKYVVLFGLPAQVARLDGFEPPSIPACISYIYCYSDMWKAFDRGLYGFMKRYIFFPCGGSQAGLLQQLLGAALCFAFVFYWHGARYYLFLWCMINFAETRLEQVGAWLETTAVVKKHLYERLSPAGIRRVRALMSVPMFIMSVFAIFYFFGGTGSGRVFLDKLMLDIPWASFGFFLLMVYCAIQNAMEVERLGLTKLKVCPYKD